MGENFNNRCQIAIPTRHPVLPRWPTGFYRDFGACDNIMQPAILTAVQIGVAFRVSWPLFRAERTYYDNQTRPHPTLPKDKAHARQCLSAMLHCPDYCDKKIAEPWYCVNA